MTNWSSAQSSIMLYARGVSTADILISTISTRLVRDPVASVSSHKHLVRSDRTIEA